MMTIDEAVAKIKENRMEKAKELWPQRSRHAAIALRDTLREITKKSLIGGKYKFNDYNNSMGDFRVLDPDGNSLFAVVLVGNKVKILTDSYRDHEHEFAYHSHDHNLMGEEHFAVACIVRMLSEIEIPEGIIDYSDFPNIGRQLSMLEEMTKIYGGTVENGRLRCGEILFAVTKHGKVYLEYPWCWDAPTLFEDLPGLLAGLEKCKEIEIRRRAESERIRQEIIARNADAKL